MSSPPIEVVPCAACSSVPQGIVGHAHLRVLFIGSAQMHFRCESCNRIWSRTGPFEGPFQWAASTIANTRKRSPGIAVPPRTDPAIVLA
jgi:hypothetical protein